MKKITELSLKYLKVDKLLHFFFGSVVFYLFLFIFNPVVALVANIIIAAGKEVYDYKSKKGQFEIMDFIFTILTAVLYMICL